MRPQARGWHHWLIIGARTKNNTPPFFSTNGRLLMAVLQWLQDNAIQYPKQVGICGYDDWDWASLAGPGISSVAQHPTAIGAVAMHQ
ncbi:substrate-binding domain-containing protein [Lacticaseibacillus saniviri]|uniref:substrate-binding domain-containing protein n=1 Tax=Lacticaseibacillus saniviri TaxID=931533 RepID=UPI0009EBC9AE